MGWGRVAGPRGRARWVSGVGEMRARGQQGAPPRAPCTWSPAGHPGSPGRVPLGRKHAGCCPVHRECPGQSPLRAVCLSSPAGEMSPPPQPEGAPHACEKEGPRVAKALQAGGGRRWPEARESRVLSRPWAAGRAPGGKPSPGLGGSPRAWLGPGGQGAAEGRAQREAGPGSHHTTPPPPPPPPHSHLPVPALPVPGKGTALGPQSHGCHGGRATGRAAFPAPWRRTLPMGARAPGPGRGTVGAAVPTSCPSMPPSGIKRPASLEAGGAEPGKLEPWPSAPGLPVGMVAALWNLALALAPAPAPSVGYGQGPEDDRPEPQAHARRRGEKRQALSPHRTPPCTWRAGAAHEPRGLLRQVAWARQIWSGLGLKARGLKVSPREWWVGE